MKNSAGAIAILVLFFCAAGCEGSKDTNTASAAGASNATSAEIGAAGATNAASADIGAAGASNASKAGSGGASASKGGKPWSEILGTAGAGGDAAECYSPVRPELQAAPLPPATKGCRCETYDLEPGPGLGRVYCLDGRAVYCPKDVGRWIVGNDGPCSPSLGSPTPLEVCTRGLGGGPVARGVSCPSGFARESNFAAAADTDADAGPASDGIVNCCYPIRVSALNCTQAGFEVLDGANTQDVLKTTCSNGKALLAFVGESGSKVCCKKD